MRLTDYTGQLLKLSTDIFEPFALDVFRYQAAHVPIYRSYLEVLKVEVSDIQSLHQIPFLPIQFFKSHPVYSKAGDVWFESSGTGTMQRSKHMVADPALYRRLSLEAFERQFGSIRGKHILALLPNYLEQKHSSLVFMINQFIQESGVAGGFYLYDHEDLASRIIEIEEKQEEAWLIGVTYALLDFAEKYPIPLKHIRVMETGGMKGRRREMIRKEVHQILEDKFSLSCIYSEYGMTELLSQAYTGKDEWFQLPPWMQVGVRELNDPLGYQRYGRGVLNIIDLANIHSCSFIATDDVGEVNASKGFQVYGRLDSADIRGCNLLVGG